MNIFSKFKEKSLSLRKPASEEVIVAVPDIKEYLVKEYERVNDLKLINEGLQQQLEKTKETEIKYDAAMVTLDEYSKRLKQSEREIIGWENRVKSLEHKLRDARNEINSYKIKFNEVAVTKEEIKAEIIEEVKKALILTFQNHKGALSKKSACEIIDAYSCNKCARYDGDDETGGAE